MARDVRLRFCSKQKFIQNDSRSKKMENSIYIGLSRQTALRRELSLVANNIANINTTGFKRELGIYAVSQTDTKFSNKLDFVIDRGTAVSFEPGGLIVTENDFDVAVNGPGFFAVDDGDGIKFSRNGALSLSPDNQLITRAGDAVVDEDGLPILIPQDGRKLQIGFDGTISLDSEVIAKMRLVEFEDHHLLQKKGNSLFETEEKPKPAENSRLLQGNLEAGNVTPVKELMRLLNIHRSYEAVNSFLEREAERQQTVIRRIGRGASSAV